MQNEHFVVDENGLTCLITFLDQEPFDCKLKRFEEKDLIDLVSGQCLKFFRVVRPTEIVLDKTNPFLRVD